jgi:hypothetical protein
MTGVFMKRLIFGIIALAILASCGDDDNGTNPESNPLYPLAVGNTWTMVMEEFDLSGNITGTENLEITLEKMVTVDGKEVYLNVEDIDDASEDTTWSGFYNDNFGTRVVLLGDNELAEIESYKYPASPGDTYSSPSVFTTYNVTVESVSDNITVEAGSFTCIKYVFESEFDYGGGEIDYERNIVWVAPEIGAIKTQAWSKESGAAEFTKTDENRLIGYTLK